MPKVDTKDATGAKAGSVELDDAMFGIEPNIPVMHQVVTAQLAARRPGTQSTKTRAEVRGGGAKPWKQKGTGRARAGSSRSPHLGRRWRGPRPQAPRLRPADPQEDDPPGAASALSDRAADGQGPRARLGPRRPEHQGRRRRPGRQRGRGPRARRARAPRTRRSGRASATSTTSTSAAPASSTPTTCSCPTGWSSPRTRSPTDTPRHPRHPRHRGGLVTKDPRDVIIAPVVSEKSYALLEDGVYTFMVHPERLQARDPRRRRGDLRRQGARR